MRYEIMFNKVRNIYTVWQICGNNSEIVKTFKTEAAAKKWIAKH